MQSYRQSEFSTNSVSRIRPQLRGLPHLETFNLHGDISPRMRGLPGLADRATRLERLYGQAALPYFSGLPHLPGVPQLHVNRPLIYRFSQG